MKSFKVAVLVRFAARLALLSLVFQLSALGHWSFGPFRADSGDLASHVAHCHGDISGCAGESGMTGSLTEVNLTPPAPAPLLILAVESSAFPSDPFSPPASKPPRV